METFTELYKSKGSFAKNTRENKRKDVSKKRFNDRASFLQQFRNIPENMSPYTSNLPEVLEEHPKKKTETKQRQRSRLSMLKEWKIMKEKKKQEAKKKEKPLFKAGGRVDHTNNLDTIFAHIKGVPIKSLTKQKQVKPTPDKKQSRPVNPRTQRTLFESTKDCNLKSRKQATSVKNEERDISNSAANSSILEVPKTEWKLILNESYEKKKLTPRSRISRKFATSVKPAVFVSENTETINYDNEVDKLKKQTPRAGRSSAKSMVSVSENIETINCDNEVDKLKKQTPRAGKSRTSVSSAKCMVSVSENTEILNCDNEVDTLKKRTPRAGKSKTSVSSAKSMVSVSENTETINCDNEVDKSKKRTPRSGKSRTSVSSAKSMVSVSENTETINCDNAVDKFKKRTPRAGKLRTSISSAESMVSVSENILNMNHNNKAFKLRKSPFALKSRTSVSSPKSVDSALPNMETINCDNEVDKLRKHSPRVGKSRGSASSPKSMVSVSENTEIINHDNKVFKLRKQTPFALKSRTSVFSPISIVLPNTENIDYDNEVDKVKKQTRRVSKSRSSVSSAKSVVSVSENTESINHNNKVFKLRKQTPFALKSRTSLSSPRSMDSILPNIETINCDKEVVKVTPTGNFGRKRRSTRLNSQKKQTVDMSDEPIISSPLKVSAKKRTSAKINGIDLASTEFYPKQKTPAKPMSEKRRLRQLILMQNEQASSVDSPQYFKSPMWMDESLCDDVFMTPGKQSMEPDEPIVYVSPFVTSSRGKKEARKEYERRKSQQGDTTLSGSDPRSPKSAALYFTKILNEQIKRIEEMCLNWQIYKETENISDDICGLIDMTIGQSNLLIHKKFEQFRGLIDKSRSNNSTEKVTPEDLHGFWDMMYKQIDNVDKRFENLEEMKKNNWLEAAPSRNTPKKMKAAKKKYKPSKSTSSLREAILAGRQKNKKQSNSEGSEIEVLFTSKNITPNKNIQSNFSTPGRGILKSSNTRSEKRKTVAFSNLRRSMVNEKENNSSYVSTRRDTPAPRRRSERLSFKLE